MPKTCKGKRLSQTMEKENCLQEKSDLENNIQCDRPRRKSQRLSSGGETKLSITSSISGLNFESMAKIGRQISNDVFDKKKEIKEDKRKEAKKDISQFLLDDLCDDIDLNANSNVVEEILQPVKANEAFSSIIENSSCSVVHDTTQHEWSGSSRVKIANGSSASLQYWRINDSNFSSEECYVFGMQHRGNWKYATLQGDGEVLKFVTSSTTPNDIDMDNGEETSDPRTFYWRRTAGSATSGYLVCASDETLAARVDGSTDQVITDTFGSFSDLWAIV